MNVVGREEEGGIVVIGRERVEGISQFKGLRGFTFSESMRNE